MKYTVKIYKHSSVIVPIDDDLPKVSAYYESDFVKSLIPFGIQVEMLDMENTEVSLQDALIKLVLPNDDKYDMVMYLYNRGTFIPPVDALAFTQNCTLHLQGTYIATDKADDSVGFTWVSMMHEILHGITYKIMNEKNIILQNILDYPIVNGIVSPFYGNDEPFLVGGNYYQALKLIAPYLKMNLLKIDSTGDGVKTLQTELNKNGANLIVDGIFGNLTKQAVINFQTSKGLLVDGIVGNQTWGALNNPLNTPPETPTSPVATSKLDLWCSAIKQMEGANPALNNPGNLRFVGQAFATNNNGFCQFDTYEHGYEALQSLITRACKGEINPPYNQNGNLYDFYNVYAPSNDGNNPTHYAQFVANIIGVPPETIISTLV